MGKDCVPKLQGFWLFKQKVMTQPDPCTLQEVNVCCVEKQCFAVCIEQCGDCDHFLKIKILDELNPVVLLGILEKFYECGEFKGQWLLKIADTRGNATYFAQIVRYDKCKKKCAKCLRFVFTSPFVGFEITAPTTVTPFPEPGFTYVGRGAAKRIRKHKITKALAKCKCDDILFPFVRA